MSECLFCRIIAGDIPAAKVYEDEEILAFRDIAPKAPLHVLVVPKKHIASLNEMEEADAPLMGRLQAAIRDIAREQGVAASGYRVILNCGPDAGQIVYHIHYHLLGGHRGLNLD